MVESEWWLFHVLDLLADFLELDFGIYNELCKVGIIGLGSNGVELTVELLAEKV